MARIPVEPRRGGSAWWIWLVGLIVIGVIAFILAILFKPTDTVQDTAEGPANESIAPVGPTYPTITDPAALFTESDSTLAGRPVQVANMRVDRVLNDSVFTVTPINAVAVPTDTSATTQSLLVILHNVAPADSGSVSGGTSLTTGQLLSVYGRIEPMDGSPAPVRAYFRQAGLVTGPPIYLAADRIEVTGHA